MGLFLLNVQTNQEIHVDELNSFVLGRQNITGCSDRRVSRNHGKLTVTAEGKLFLTALSCNPCFYTKNGIPPVLHLYKNQEQILSEGDHIGLLPDAFWFQVVKKSNQVSSQEPERNQDLQSNSKNNKNKELDPSDIESINEKTDSNDVIKTELIISNANDQTSNFSHQDAACSNNIGNTKDRILRFGMPEFEKTRRLPLWRYQIHDFSNSTGSIKQDNAVLTEETKGPKRNSGQEFDKNRNIHSTFSSTSMNSSEKKEITTVVDELSTTINECLPSTSGSTKPKTPKLVDVTENEIDNEKEVSRKRSFCQYGDRCYRKSSQHKNDFSHPGDEDWVSYEERPICEYGANCYRKNESHKIQFRHPQHNFDEAHSVSDSSLSSDKSRSPSVLSWCSPTQIPGSPLPAKRRRKTIKRNNVDSNECDDEEDPEDPFFGDASSDEYLPEESDSECELELYTVGAA